MRLLSLLLSALLASAAAQSAPRVVRLMPSSAEIAVDGKKELLEIGQSLSEWTLMGMIAGPGGQSERFAILEDFAHPDGRMIFVGTKGVQLDLPKSSEPTAEDRSRLYFGHTIEQVMQSPTDLLGNEILAKPGDPDYAEVAAAFPPIGRKMTTYSFVGTPETMDKVGFVYGGRTANFDPAPYYPPLAAIRETGQARDGLVGGYLPILRFVYPESDGNWTEMLAFAALRMVNGNNRVQPVWYRVARVEDHRLKWAQYVDSYHPFPPRTKYNAADFYRDILRLDRGWQRKLQGAMRIDVPDERVANMARFALVREMMTRVVDFPKYGAVDKDYAGSEHDGFPDTFNVDTASLLEWGLVEQAGRYIDNFFGKFVRDDGSLLYRGPETGQYGRMLTVVAQYLNYGGDPAVALRQRSRIDGVTKLLLMLRTQAKRRSQSDPAYGMIAGWSEADASLDADPPRYMQPYFSNSTEAARGFRDLGKAWETLGKQRKSSDLVSWGQKLQREAEELERDIQTAISRSILKVDGETILPSIAGVKQPFHVAVPLDQSDPQFRSYRAYVEMMHSGILSADQARTIVEYRARHHDMILGVPTAYGFNTGVLAGFLSYGHGYGLIQHDMIREALLLLYSDMAHQYTRGTWTAPETRSILPDQVIAPYCTPAQLVVALLTKWLLVFEDPKSETVWLAKAAPREWLEDGKSIAVERAPTRWGRLSFKVTSQIVSRTIAIQLTLPPGFGATTKLRLRAPKNAQLKSVTVNGKAWDQFDAVSETITIPPIKALSISVLAHY
jgi:hypothetical protein